MAVNCPCWKVSGFSSGTVHILPSVTTEAWLGGILHFIGAVLHFIEDSRLSVRA
eukprot:COSAG03_NODE_1979_length_3263_cov_47.989268_5_plen_54_part_00